MSSHPVSPKTTNTLVATAPKIAKMAVVLLALTALATSSLFLAQGLVASPLGLAKLPIAATIATMEAPLAFSLAGVFALAGTSLLLAYALIQQKESHLNAMRLISVQAKANIAGEKTQETQTDNPAQSLITATIEPQRDETSRQSPEHKLPKPEDHILSTVTAPNSALLGPQPTQGEATPAILSLGDDVLSDVEIQQHAATLFDQIPKKIASGFFLLNQENTSTHKKESTWLSWWKEQVRELFKESKHLKNLIEVLPVKFRLDESVVIAPSKLIDFLQKIEDKSNNIRLAISLFKRLPTNESRLFSQIGFNLTAEGIMSTNHPLHHLRLQSS